MKKKGATLILQLKGSRKPTTQADPLLRLYVPLPPVHAEVDAEEGVYTLTVMVQGSDGTSGTLTATAQVADAPLDNGMFTGGLNIPVAQSWSGPLFSFHDQNSQSSLSDFTATIDWGDGSTSSGTITSLGTQAYGVTGTHTYTQAGSYMVQVQVTDDGGNSLQGSGTIVVSDNNTGGGSGGSGSGGDSGSGGGVTGSGGGDGSGSGSRHNMPPAFLLPPNADTYTFTVAENSPEGTLVGALSAADPNDDPLTYTILTGNSSGVFALDPHTGQITVANSGQLDYETTSHYTLTVQVSDGQFGDVATVLIALQDVDEPPQFTQDVYSFTVGEGAQKGVWVDRVIARDPEQQAVTYTLIGPELVNGVQNDYLASGHFAIESRGDSAGWLRVARDLPIDGSEEHYEFRVEAWDPAGHSSFACVQIAVHPLVVLTGDLQGVEATGDTIRLELVRFSHDLSYPLEVTYRVDWDTATPDDLENPEGLVAAGQAQRTVTFAANQDRLTLPVLRPRADGQAKGAEHFRVSIVNRTEDTLTPYVTLRGGVQSLEGKLPGFVGQGRAKVTILDDITLFGANNLDREKRDRNALGVDVNDIAQGMVGDCYFLAAIGALAQRDPEWVANGVFTRNPDGTVSLWFFPEIGPPAQRVTVSLTLDYGWTQAQLTEDRDGQGRYEVWPIIWEKAYRQWVGWERFGAGGSPARVWEQLMNAPAWTYNPADYNLSGVVALVRRVLGEGRKVVFGTAAAEKEAN
jgi:hypothetical protein